MEHKIWFDDSTGIVIVNVYGIFNIENAFEVERTTSRLMEGKEFRQLLVDLTEAHKLEDMETRRTLTRIVNSLAISDVAYVGAGSANRIIAKVLMKIGGLKVSADFFKSQQDAITWLINRRKKK